MKNNIIKFLCVAIILSLCSSSLLAISNSKNNFLPNTQSYSPFIYPLMYFKTHPNGSYNLIWNMYCINLDYDAYVDSGSATGIASPFVIPNSQANGSIQEPYINQYYVGSGSSTIVPFISGTGTLNFNSGSDVLQYAFDTINSMGAQVSSLGVYFGESSTFGPNDVAKYFTNIPKNNISILKGESTSGWSALNSHAKLFLADNSSNLFVSVMGSVNLQTVEMTSKANNSIRIVENSNTPGTASIYNYFLALNQAICSGSATTPFNEFSNQTSFNSGSGLLPSINVGNYTIQFYAGISTGFSGGLDYLETKNSNSYDTFPGYLNPPILGQYSNSCVNWYDQVIYNAATQLREGNNVIIDIAMFEVGDYNRFVDNLFNFVKYGFGAPNNSTISQFPIEDKNSSASIATPFPGHLTVNFLWQSQDNLPPYAQTYTYQDLHQNAPSYCFNVSGSSNISGSSVYLMHISPIWPIKNTTSIMNTYGMDTPQDMHNKFAIMYVPTNPSANTLYVSSSNLDKPGVDGGTLWQVGTVIQPSKSVPDLWAGPSGTNTSGGATLFSAYLNYFNLLSQTSVYNLGYKNAYQGQEIFSNIIFPLTLQGKINWIETVPYDPTYQTPMKPGIDSFFYPIPITTSPPFTP